MNLKISKLFQFGELLGRTYSPGNVLVPGLGWFIFGGVGNDLKTSQRLRSLDAKWEAGPNLYGDRYDSDNCLVHVSFKTSCGSFHFW
jgi:hypothetical protein